MFPRRHLHRSPRLTPRALRASGAARAPPAPAPRLSWPRLVLPPPASSFTPFRPLHNFKDKSSQRLLGPLPRSAGMHDRAFGRSCRSIRRSPEPLSAFLRACFLGNSGGQRGVWVAQESLEVSVPSCRAIACFVMCRAIQHPATHLVERHAANEKPCRARWRAPTRNLAHAFHPHAETPVLQ